MFREQKASVLAGPIARRLPIVLQQYGLSPYIQGAAVVQWQDARLRVW